MPVVPISRKKPEAPSPAPAQVDPSYLLMAAGLMSKEGKIASAAPAPSPTGNPDRTVLGAPRG